MKYKFPREFYIPKGATETAYPEADMVVYTGEFGGKAFAMGFGGKRSKYDFYYTYSSAERRDEAVAKYVAGGVASMKAKAERKAEKNAKMSKPQPYKVGDLLYTSWGYDQTNVDFYEVVGLFGKRGVVIKAIAGEHVEATGPVSEKIKPAPGKFLDEERYPPIRSIVGPDGHVKARYGYYASPISADRAVHHSWGH